MSANLNITKLKLGQSANPAQNFLISTPTPEDGTLTIERENGTDVMTIDATGKVIFPGNVVPMYVAAWTNPIGSVFGAGLLVMPEVADNTDAYSAGRFTPTVAGWYQCSVNCQYAATTMLYALVEFRKNGVTTIVNIAAPYATAYAAPCVAGLVYLNGSGDYLEVHHDIAGTGSPSLIRAQASAVLTKAGA